MEIRILGAALLALAVLVPALALFNFKPFGDLRRNRFTLREMLRDLSRSELGATILYTTPVIGAPSATAITASQAAATQTQVAQITFADGDTTIPFVHNWGLPASFPTWGFPEISYYWLSQNASPTSFGTALTFGIANTNQVTVNKTSVGVGSGGVLQVILRRPHSIGQ